MNARFSQRIPDELHEKLKSLSKRRGVSINDFVNMLISKEVQDDEERTLKREVMKMKIAHDTREYTFGLVEYDRETKVYYVEPTSDPAFQSIEVCEANPFSRVDGELNDVLDHLCKEWFDDEVGSYSVDDETNESIKDNFDIETSDGMVRIFCNYGAFTGTNFETEDLRKDIRLPNNVDAEDAIYIIFTNGNEEGDILEWAVFYPVE